MSLTRCDLTSSIPPFRLFYHLFSIGWDIFEAAGTKADAAVIRGGRLHHDTPTTLTNTFAASETPLPQSAPVK